MLLKLFCCLYLIRKGACGNLFCTSGTIGNSCFVFFTFSFRVETIYDEINERIRKKSIQTDFKLSKLGVVMSRISALTGILVCAVCIREFEFFLIPSSLLSRLCS